LTYDHFDRVAALGLVGAVGLRAIAVGEVAGALHGWPLIRSEEGTLDLVVHPEDREIAEASVLAAATSRGRVRHGFAALARAAITVTIQRPAVEIAGLVDLLRIALSSSESHSKLFALALDATLQLTARGASLKPTKLSPREQRARADAWLARQAV
jgi:hypothetical protein